MDTVILNDISRAMTEAQCRRQQQTVAGSIKPMRGDSSSSTIPQSRVACIEFDANNRNNLVPPIDSNYNANPVTQSDITSFYNQVQNSGDCINTPFTTGEPDLDAALDMAWHEFHMAETFTGLQNRGKPSIKLQNACDIAAEYRMENVNIPMVHNGDYFPNAGSYLPCLVQNDKSKIITKDEFGFSKWDTEIRDNVQDLICNYSPPTTTAWL